MTQDSAQVHEAGPATITVNGQDYELPEVLTIGELTAVELGLGAGIDDLPPASSMYALAWIAMRRKHPRLTWGAFSSYAVTEVTRVGAEDEAEDEGQDGEHAGAEAHEPPAAVVDPPTLPKPKRSRSESSK